MNEYEKLSTLIGDELKTYLESIVKYYQDRLDEQMRKVSNEPVECQHESDDDCATDNGRFELGYMLCTKCGEFYR